MNASANIHKKININNLNVWATLLMLSLIILWPHVGALAQAVGTVGVGGQDNSGQMKEVQNVLTTLQTIGFKWIAPLLGAGLAIFGLFLVATRRVAPAIFALVGGGCLFFVEKIAGGLANLGGGA